MNKHKKRIDVFNETLDRLNGDDTDPAEEIDEIIARYKELIRVAGEDNQLLIKAINVRIKELINHFISCFENE